MEKMKFTVLDLLDLDLKEHNALNLRCIGGRPGLSREIKIPNINRPGLALSGFFEDFAHLRLQIFGRGENAYLRKLHEEGNSETIEQMFQYEIPCAIFTHSLSPYPDFFEIAERAGCPILQTDISSSEFSSRILRALSNVFAASETIHGGLVEVCGVGDPSFGDRGVGQREAA